MKVRIIQVYEIGIEFQFSSDFQVYMTEEISNLIACSKAFEKKYGEEYTLVFYMSAKKDLNDLEIKGPGVYRKDKEIEHTIYLPFTKIQESDCVYKSALEYLFTGIKSVLSKYGIEIREVESEQNRIIEQILNAPNMIEN